MTKTKKPPYITAVKLAEYMTAKVLRRRQLVKELQKDRDFAKLYYGGVKKALPKYFKNGYDSSIIDDAIKNIEKKKSGTEWTDRDHPNSILALKSLKKMDPPNLENFEFVTDIKKLDHVMLSGVKVTLKPEIYLRNSKNGKVGAIKSHIAKTVTNRLNLDGMQYAANLLKYGFIQNGYEAKQIDNSGCICVDVFESSYNSAPNAYKASINRLEAACEEFLLRWESL